MHDALDCGSPLATKMAGDSLPLRWEKIFPRKGLVRLPFGGLGVHL